MMKKTIVKRRPAAISTAKRKSHPAPPMMKQKEFGGSNVDGEECARGGVRETVEILRVEDTAVGV